MYSMASRAREHGPFLVAEASVSVFADRGQGRDKQGRMVQGARAQLALACAGRMVARAGAGRSADLIPPRCKPLAPRHGQNFAGPPARSLRTSQTVLKVPLDGLFGGHLTGDSN